jgi:hypothetical protein
MRIVGKDQRKREEISSYDFMTIQVASENYDRICFESGVPKTTIDEFNRRRWDWNDQEETYPIAISIS